LVIDAVQDDRSEPPGVVDSGPPHKENPGPMTIRGAPLSQR